MTWDRRIGADRRLLLNGRVPSGTLIPPGPVMLRITLQDKTRDSEGKPFFGGSYYLERLPGVPFTLLARYSQPGCIP